MAIGDLLYEKVYDFSVSPAVTYSIIGSGATAGYDSGSKTLQASVNSDSCSVLITNEPASGIHDCELELTIKMTADFQARRHMGIWLLNETGSLSTGYRGARLDGNVQMFRFADTTTSTQLGLATDVAFNLGQTYTLLFKKTNNLIEFFIDGVKKLSAIDAIYTSVRPGIYLYCATVQVAKIAWRHFVSAIDEPTFNTTPLTAIPANQETRAQFQPQDVAWRGAPPLFPGPVSQQPVTNKLLCQPGQDLFWTRDGVQNVLQGYIESTVTISGEGVRRRVLCFDQAGNLIAETWSRASDGKYRFDLLWLNRRYMLVAQDDPAFGPADYNAVAADFQLPTPYAPGQGVGLTGG